MAQQLEHAGTDAYFVFLLLLLSYVMSSAPRLVKDYRDAPRKESPAPEAPGRDWKKLLNAYTLQPYKNAWEQLTSGPKLLAGRP